jgi:hypothetical protein
MWLGGERDHAEALTDSLESELSETGALSAIGCENIQSASGMGISASGDKVMPLRYHDFFRMDGSLKNKGDFAPSKRKELGRLAQIRRMAEQALRLGM